jgi:polyribonucleotide nucleotidyltransferase
MNSISFDLSGKKMEIATGKMARQADGAVTVRLGDTIVLVTAVSTKNLKEGVGYFPLTVDYREKSSASGRFPGGFIKREGRPTEKEILTCRLTDRPIRPLFPEDYLYEVQVIASVLSADESNDPDILSINGASAALHISDIPFDGPVGAVRVGRVAGAYIINPTYEEKKKSDIDLVIAATEKGIVMVEGSSNIVSEEDLLAALKLGFEAAQVVIKAQKELREKAGKPKRQYEVADKPDEKLLAKVKELTLPSLRDTLMTKGKKDREVAMDRLFHSMAAKIQEADPEADLSLISLCFQKLEKEKAREIILKEKVRCDGRGFKDIRPITAEVGILPRTHGSGLFTRGETQSLVITSLGGADDAQKLESYEGEAEKVFMMHYNFPPFSVGEVGPMRGPGRREIGHGMLAERALSAVLPSKEQFPYTIRLVSDVLESNGSSSMATVCGGSLSLMDTGVPIKAQVAGIAMGLVVEGKDKAILSDIMGMEDHLGDMDFKVAGTKDGITAFQMDLKVESIDYSVLKEALYQAKEGRLAILDVMNRTLESPRPNLSRYAPRILTITIRRDKIGALIGPGGSNIKKLTEKYKVQINIEDDGTVTVLSENEASAKEAVEEIQMGMAEVEVGKTYKGTVKNIVDFGCFVEVLPGKEGLVHISRLANHRVNRVEDVVKLGDTIYVKCTDIDEKGRVVLSKKDADNEMNKS